MTLTDLDSVVKQSLAKASSHSRKVYGKNPLTAQEVLDLANSKAMILAATVKPDGKPHLSPSDLAAFGGKLYLGVDKATARYRNLQRNPAVVVMMTDGWERQAILEGKTQFLDMKGELVKKVLDVQKKKYGWVTDSVSEFLPEKAFTWKA